MTGPLLAALILLTAVRSDSHSATGESDALAHRSVAFASDSVIRQFAVPVRMRDGVTLIADVYRPAVAHPVPVVLERTPYMRTGAGYAAAGKRWAALGYAYVVQDVRGRGDSEGQFDPLAQEVADGFDTQTWAGQQPWSTGRVGTVGGSYGGWTQTLPAHLNNPAVGAMIPTVTPSDPGGFWPQRRGGLSFGMLEWAMVVEGRTTRALPYELFDLVAAYKTRPIRDADLAIGSRSEIWREYLDRLEDADYWAARSYQHLLPRSTIPMLHVTGWYDGTLGGSLENFAAMRTKGSAAARQHQYLVVGPWRHWVAADSRKTSLRGVEFGEESRVDLGAMSAAWFEHYLRRGSTDPIVWPRVRVFQMGANRWLGGDDWPLGGTRMETYYLDRAGNAGILTPASPRDDRAADRYSYDPADPTPFLWEVNVDSGNPDDYRPVEARPDVLVYTMPSPRTELSVCGPVRATLFAASSARDTDWVARLSLVRADGYSQRLTEGWVRARERRGNFRNDPLVPEQVERYDLDLWGTCVLVKPGERLRLAVMSAAFPLLVPNFNTGGDLALETTPVIAEQTIRRGGAYASFISLPVVPAPRVVPKP
ncbi:MAG: CocE/NonD family hydrolase [Gemmatimonadales bacterium]